MEQTPPRVISIMTDPLSGATVELVVAHVAAVRFDRTGANSPRAYTIYMAGGATFQANRTDGERLMAALS